VLPEPPCRPETRRDAVAPPEGGVALAAAGANIATEAADNTNSLRVKPIRFSFSMW
jgi:hypothetical protein